MDPLILQMHESYDRSTLRYVVGPGAPVGMAGEGALDRSLFSSFFGRRESLRFLSDETAALETLAAGLAQRFGADAVRELCRLDVGRGTAAPADIERELGELVRAALYGGRGRADALPTAVHHELAAAILGPKYTSRAPLITHAMDDLLPLAFEALGTKAAIVTDQSPAAHGEAGPTLACLHGYVPPSGPHVGSLVLSERDGAGPGGAWGDALVKELLFGADPPDVLLVGVSLADHALRRLLLQRMQAAKKQRVGRIVAVATPEGLGAATADESRVFERGGRRLAAEWERAFFGAWGVETITAAGADQVPYILRQIRLGVTPSEWAALGSKWLAARHAYDELYSEKRQHAAEAVMRSTSRYLRSRFAIPREEEIHLGVHIPAEDDPKALRIAFHFVGAEEGVSLLPNILTEAAARQRELSIGAPDAPEGATGHAFVTGNVTEAHIGDDRMHMHFSGAKTSRWHQGPRTFTSLLAIPVYAALAGHLPVAVAYIDSNRRQPFWKSLGQDDFRDLCGFFSRVCMTMLRSD